MLIEWVYIPEYSMWIGISIGINIDKFFSSVATWQLKTLKKVVSGTCIFIFVLGGLFH